MKILYLVLCVNAFILVDARTDPGYSRQYRVVKNQKTIANKGYLIVPVLPEVSPSNVFKGRQFPWRRTIPLVPQSDSVGGQAGNNQVSLLSLIALALNLGNSLFAVPAAPVQRDPASSVAAGVTTGILNYISAQGGQNQPTFNDPVAGLGITLPQNDVATAMVADSAGVSKVRQYMRNPFPFGNGNWEWETEIIRENKKNSRRVPSHHMTNLNIFLNRGPHSQQVFNRMKNYQNMKKSQRPRFLSFDIPKRVIVLVPEHHVHHTHHRPIPSHHYQPSYQPSYKPHKPSHKPSYHHSYPSHHYPEPSYGHKPHHDDVGEYTVPVVIEDDEDEDDDDEDEYDDEDDYYRIYKLSTELVEVPLDYIAQPAKFDDRPSQISMDEDDYDDNDNNNNDQNDDEKIEESEMEEGVEVENEDVEQQTRSEESSKEIMKGEELKQINNRLKRKKA